MVFERVNKEFMQWIEKIRYQNQKVREDRLRHEEFLSDFHKACLDLEAARHNYNFAKEPALLEYYIYEIKAAETRVNYFLKLAKKDNFKNMGYFQKMFEKNKLKGEGLS